jgi:hypothetical protein
MGKFAVKVNKKSVPKNKAIYGQFTVNDFSPDFGYK